MTELERWLEEELERGFVPFSAAPIPAGAPYRIHRPALSPRWVAARVVSRMAVVVVVAALGLTATGAMAASALTGTADPRVWAQDLNAAIATCAGQPGTTNGGIGSCIGAFLHHEGPGDGGSPAARTKTEAAAPNPNRPVKATGPAPQASPATLGNATAGPDPVPSHGRPTGAPSQAPQGEAHAKAGATPALPPNGRGKPPATPRPKHP